MSDNAQADPKLTVRAQHISTPRIAPYLARTGGNLKAALSLYHWNVDFSASAYEALHLVEVVMRNAIDAELCVWNATQINATTGLPRAADWLLDPAPVLERLLRGDEKKAYAFAKRSLKSRREPTHSDVIAQTAFGTWRFLLPQRVGNDAGRDLLWREAIAKAFPGHSSTDPEGLTRAVESLYRIRNRVAHLEPLLTANAKAVLADMRRVLAAIDPHAEEWVVSRQRLTAVHRARPSR